MKSIKLMFLLSVLFVLFVVWCYAQVIPSPVGYVNDFAGVIDKKSVKDMSSRIGAFKDKAEIAVVTIKSLEGQDVETYTHTLAVKWGVGKKGKDNGVVILIAVKERKVRIEVGYGLESVIPDGIAKRIIEQDMKPYLKKNDFGGGLSAGVDAVIKRIREKGDKK